jgi:hypothetical protein
VALMKKLRFEKYPGLADSMPLRSWLVLILLWLLTITAAVVEGQVKREANSAS